ncbi:hypothetical protein MD588_24805 [Photobacterium sp. SDRW27]|uniref:hypothetical protein n=1 Tax=Photobacterium obscurum TaxID=2829490 RepID=UPI00224410C7|nr:hypothetical protein [Photobacterium obscurum]MCW8332017.1 hypothetical protein [Photobacterium obscurum]
MERIELDRDEETKLNRPIITGYRYPDICITFQPKDPSEKPEREAPGEYDLDLFKATGIRPDRTPHKTLRQRFKEYWHGNNG